jgi:two-component system NtrC family sensor kinase
MVAAHGEQALSIIRSGSQAIDLLLTDVVMPGMNGRELAERLGALRPGIRALFMSGYSDGSITDRGLLATGASLIQKPFSGDALKLAVRKALEQR